MCRIILATSALALLSALSAHATEQMTVADFEYDSAEAAQAEWVAAEESLPVGIMERDGGTAMTLNADFTTDSRRAVYDKQVDLDLTRWGRLTLDVYVDDPGLFGNFTLYFQSEQGWYGAGGGGLGRKGWNTLHFPRSAFRIEDNPTGWNHITGIRLAAWRGSERKGFCAVDNFLAYYETKVVVLGTHTIAKQSSEARTVRQYAELMSNLLQNAGIATATVGDEDVEAGGLEGRELAIFAYNPDMTEAEIAKVREFVAAGGKVFVFYTLGEGMGEILGIRTIGWERAAYTGQFSEMRFAAEGIMGLPQQARQGSWNVNVVEPMAEGAKVIGRWYDDQGKDTGYPAFTMSEAGVYMSHILMGDDYENKKALMVALVGHYFPQVWPETADRALQGPGRIGHIDGVEQARAWIEAHAAVAPNATGVRSALAGSAEAGRQAVAQVNAGQYPQAVTTAAEAYRLLGEAYVLAHVPRVGEFRACWEHSGTGAYDDWDTSMTVLRDCGFNAVVPNMWWGGVAHYDSEYLPHSTVMQEQGDQIAQCVAAGKKYGIEVHPWKVNWNLGSRVPEDFKQQLRDEGRLQVDYNGDPVDWLCPSSPENLELELNTMVEVARKYEVDGVHFDYIRYPHGNACFCDGCRERFQKDTGIAIENWPQDTRREDVKEAWIQWRCDQISALVRGTAEQVRRIKPHCKISAAVFGSYPGCRVGVGQDWPYWIEQGWLDFVCPMDYTNSDTRFASLVATQMSQVVGRIPLYPGIGASSSSSALTPDRVAGQIEIARNLGADGFIIFNYTRSLAENVLPELGRAILSEPARALPHNAPRYEFVLSEASPDATYGLHVEEGATVQATVTRAPDLPGRDFGKHIGDVVLEDADGRVVERLGEAPSPGQPLKVAVSAQRGLFRIAVVGQWAADGPEHQFVSRSLPIVFGGLRDDIAALR